MEDVLIVEATGDQIVAVQRKGLTEEQWEQYTFVDNYASDASTYDIDILREISQEVDLESFCFPGKLEDLFNELEGRTSELAESQETEGGGGGESKTPHEKKEEDQEAIEKLLENVEEVEPRVKPGEIWALGRHRICCGDSTIEGNLRTLLGDHFGDVGMVWSDPPYGVSVVQVKEGLGTIGGSKPFGSKESRGSVAAGNACPVGIYAPIIGDSTTETAINSYKSINSFAPKSVQIIWGGNYYADSLPPKSCWIVWDKRDGMTSNNFADAELAWTNQNSPTRVFSHLWNGMIKASERGEKRVHPTQKPVALFTWCAEKYGKPGDIVFDPFLGSGISVIGCEQLNDNRTVFGFELSPEYIEVTCRRYESLTGDTAKLVGHL